jgi:hypothetical protein
MPRQAVFRAAFTAFRAVLLSRDPLTEVRVGERFEQLAAFAITFDELVVVDEGMESMSDRKFDLRSMGSIVPRRAS